MKIASPPPGTRKKILIASMLIPALWIGMAQPARATGVLIHDYQFSGNFADSLAGPALVPLNGTGTLNPTSYSFAAGQGLSLSSGLTSSSNYSIVADFSFAATSGYRKIVDFKTQAADAGLYNLSTALNFYPVTTGPSGAFADNVTLSMALTRDGTTNQVTGYVNGTQHITFTDGGSLGVFTGTNNEIRFFIDDTTTGGGEASAGVVDRIRIFDGALTAAQLTAILFPATHWLGGTDGKWTGNVNNWARDAAGTPTTAIPTSTEDVTFSANGAANQGSTTLEQDFTIHSLTINDTTPVGIGSGTGGPHTLTISGNAGTGITVATGATLSLSANVMLAGASDTIAVNGTGVATISGVLGSSNGLAKTGTGTLTLASGASTYSGGTSLYGGRLNVDASSTPTSGAPVTSGPIGTGPLTIFGGTLGSTVSGVNIANNINVQGDFSVAPATTGSLRLLLNGSVDFGGATRRISAINGTTGATFFGGSISNGGLTLASDAPIGPPPSFANFVFFGTAPNTYTGLTTVEANAGLTLRKTSGVNAMGGDLLIQSGGVVFNSIAAGTGNEQIPDTAVVTVNSVGNSGLGFVGGWLLQAHTETIGSLFGNGIINLGDTFPGGGAGTLIVGAGDFSGQITDGTAGVGGQLIKNTPGTLILSGANTYTGDTNVNGGTLAVNGSIASANTFVNPGGTLGGMGTIGGNVSNSGIVSPGNSPGTLTIAGNFTQLSSGTLQIEIAGRNAGQFDVLAVGGTASLNGTLKLITLGGFVPATTDTFTILTAVGGRSGTFATVDQTLSTVKFDVKYLSNSVLLEFVQTQFVPFFAAVATIPSFAGYALTPNQRAVAGAIDSASRDPQSSNVINFLLSENIGKLPNDFDLIGPEELTSIFHIAVSLAKIQNINILRRLEEIRTEAEGGMSGTSAGGVADAGGGMHGPNGPRGKGCSFGDDERWGMWFTGSGEFTRVGSTSNAAGFDLDSGGVTAGVDYRFTDKFAAGISIGYMNTTASLASGGKVDVDGGRVGAYATYFNRGLHLDAAVSGGPNSYATRRTTPNNTTATGSPEGTEVNLLFAAGYDWKWKGVTLGPTASFQYTNVQLNGFTERGAFAPLSIAAQNAESLRSALGVHATFDVKMGRAILRPEVRAAWQHEFGDTSYSLTSSFATLGGRAFTVAGPETGRDSLLVGAGFSILWTDRFSTTVFYDGELLRTNYSSNNVSVGFRYRF